MSRIATGNFLGVALCLLAGFSVDSLAADISDSPGAKITREKKLKAKITVDCDNEMLRDIIAELQGGLRDVKAGTVRIKPDPKSGITLTTRMTIKAKNAPFDEVLDKLFSDCGRPWGYYVYVSTKKDDQDDGAIINVADPTCRGYPSATPPRIAKKGELIKEELRKK
jgi:hypothetical protein